MIRRPGVHVVALVALGVVLLAADAALTTLVPASLTGIILDGARCLYEGQGFVSHGATLGFLTAYRHLTLPAPYLWYPFMPLVTAGLFFVAGVKPWLVLVVPVLGYLASGLALWALGRRLFAPATALLAAAVLMMQPNLIDTAVEANFTDPIMLALLLGCVLAVFVARQGGSLWWVAAGGCALGVAQYARSAGVALYVPILFLVASAFPGRRVRAAAMLFVPCALVQVPLVLYYWRVTGSPTFMPTYLLLFLTSSFPGMAANRLLLPPSALAIFQQWGGEILRKWVGQVWVHYKYFFTMTSPLVVAGAVLGVLRPARPDVVLLRNFTLVFYGWLVALNSLAIWDNRYLLPVIPFVALFGIDALRSLVAHAVTSPRARAAAAAALALLVSVETIDFYYQAVKRRPELARRRDDKRALARFVRASLRPDDVVLSVDVGLVAWETRNVVVGMPLDLATAARIRADYVPFNVALLSRSLPAAGLYNFSPEWERVVSGRQDFLGFQKEREITLPSGEVVVLLRAPGGSRR
ncbi:MAG: glycosyltransferase family 39 protein [Candidatus Rokubacteria bacterium]|nr:glycosyltransferase family 39 protein [Candidatus Rokubacteria bacterium]